MNKKTTVPVELGVPVKGLNWVRLQPGKKKDGTPVLLASMGQGASPFFVCDIDLSSGHCCQYPAGIEKGPDLQQKVKKLPGWDYETARFPSAVFMEPATGILYLGSAYVGHFHRFDPNCPESERRVEDLGPIDPGLATFACQIDQAPDGMIYIGAWPGCCLSRFDPVRGIMTPFGRMDEHDMYFYPLCGKDGTVAGLVKMSREHVVVFNPKTGEHRTVGPVVEKERKAKDNLSINLFKAVDGLLYINSSMGNFRVEGMEAFPVDKLPDAIPFSPQPEAKPSSTLPDGSRVELADKYYRHLRLTTPAGTTRDINLDWKGEGSEIMIMGDGPDGRIYGSTFLPEHLFSCRPDGSDMTDHGHCSVVNGEAYSFGNLNGKLFIASYPGAHLSIYDPSRPYRLGTDKDANPRDIGRSDPISYRPRAMLAGPAGKIWIGSHPDYGTWGGTLVSFDPKTEQFSVHRHLIQDCAVQSLAWLKDRNQILVGTNVFGGTGTEPRVKEAGFVIWNPDKDCAETVTTFGEQNIRDVFDLWYAGEGRVYAVVIFDRPEPAPSRYQYSAELLLIDLNAGKVVDRSAFSLKTGWPLDVALRQSASGNIYGLSNLYLYRVKPGTAQREIIWKSASKKISDHVHAQGPIIGKQFYFATQQRIRCVELPED